jgi:hypothetical protein
MKAGERISLSAYSLPVFIFIFITLVCPLFAQAESGEDLTVKIAVMGPGTELYFWWGHIGLVIENNRTGQGRFYDYGLFSFDNENFFVNFALGRLLYSCGASSPWANVNTYINTNRDVTFYTLDIPPEKREEVRNFANTNILPANRDYYYHHFKDNCATRIRDILDIATGGQFRERYGAAPGRYTNRQHVRRHTWFSPFFDWMLSFLMGQDIDRPMTVWQEMFLPAEVGSRAAEFYYTDTEGVSRRLVSGVEVVNRAIGRPEVLDVPRRQWPRELAFGIAVMALLGLFFFLRTKGPVGQVLAGLSQSLIGLFFGLSGLLLFFMSFFTNHDYTFHNVNLLFTNPLLLAAVPLGIRYAAAPAKSARERPEIMLRVLWFLVLLGLVVSMLLKLLPWFYQANLVDQMLMLPIVLVLCFEPFGTKELMERVFWRWL